MMLWWGCAESVVTLCSSSHSAGVRLQELCDTLQDVFCTNSATISKRCCYFCVFNSSGT